jgi:hypothetical protein
MAVALTAQGIGNYIGFVEMIVDLQVIVLNQL